MKSQTSSRVIIALAILTFVGAMACNLLPILGGEPRVQFAARQDVVEIGECTYLEWEVQGADDYPVFLEGEQVGASGRKAVCPEDTTMYELVIGAPGGPYQERVVIQVKDGPGPTPTSAPPPPAATTAPASAAATATPPPPAATPAPPPPTQTPPPPTNTPQIGGITVDGITFDLISLTFGVETAGINSHQPEEWCYDGWWLVGLDLDRQGAYDPLDSPVVGQALCRSSVDNRPWAYPCSWVGVETAGINSHQPAAWCPDGTYLVGMDLDRQGAYDPLDSPVVGQVGCCPMVAHPHWGECSWVGVERAGINSHELHDWCPVGSYLAGMDLDRQGAYDPLDSPVVGQAYCCSPQ